MQRQIQKVLIIVNHLKDSSLELVKQIQDYLSNVGVAAEVAGFKDGIEGIDFENTDMAISLGGDGTVLYTAGLVSAKCIPILAVNLGDFGFITEVSISEWQEVFDKYCSGEIGISERLMIHSRIIRNGNTIAAYTGLNDCVISSTGMSKIIRLQVELSGDRLGAYRADGVIVSTPTGSTAYSMAAGGPILDPELEAMIINPICPFTLSNRPIVVPGTEKVSVSVMQQQRTDIILTVDGQNSFTLQPEDRIEFVRAKEKALIIRSNTRTFYEVLRTKLKWSGGPDA